MKMIAVPLALFAVMLASFLACDGDVSIALRHTDMGLRSFWNQFEFEIYSPRAAAHDESLPIVKLRNSIINLVEGNIVETKGATGEEEFYLLFKPGSGARYCLIRIHKGKNKEHIFFPSEWPANGELEIPDKLMIQGNPFGITCNSTESGQYILKVEE